MNDTKLIAVDAVGAGFQIHGYVPTAAAQLGEGLLKTKEPIPLFHASFAGGVGCTEYAKFLSDLGHEIVRRYNEYSSRDRDTANG